MLRTAFLGWVLVLLCVLAAPAHAFAQTAMPSDPANPPPRVAASPPPARARVVTGSPGPDPRAVRQPGDVVYGPDGSVTRVAGPSTNGSVIASPPPPPPPVARPTPAPPPSRADAPIGGSGPDQ